MARSIPGSLLALLLAATGGCGGSSVDAPIDPSANSVSEPAADQHPQLADRQFGTSAQTFCGDCHATPQPRSFSRQHWQREVQRGFDFYFASGRADLVVPRAADITRYFSELAPTSLALPSPEPLDRDA